MVDSSSGSLEPKIYEETAAIRAYTIPHDTLGGKEKENRKNYFVTQILPELKRQENERISKIDRFLVFDTETRVDLYQNLTFGYFEVYLRKSLEHKGIFFDQEVVNQKEKKILEEYSVKTKSNYTQ